MTEFMDLGSACGDYLTFRDLIECGPSWRRLSEAPDPGERIDNRPRQSASYSALRYLARSVLDPVSARFGPVTLTYGFSSATLARSIQRGIAPRLDQHAACELRRDGRPVCPRLGAAADFFVPGTSSLLVAKWVVTYCDFDRLYYFGPDRPLHVSAGPDESRQVVVLRLIADGRRMPSVHSRDRFLAL